MSSPDTTAGPTADADLPCPLCGYNLRGLADPRCRECGFAFRWDELLDARRAEQPFLFEHGHRGLARRFVQTYALSALPRRFWRRVTPANPVGVGRLIAYWAVVNVLLVVVAVAAVTTAAVSLAESNAADRTATYKPDPDQPGKFVSVNGRTHVVVTQADIDAADPRPASPAFAAQLYRSATFPRVAEAALLAAVWPWLTAAALLVYRTSFRQATVHAGHVLRAAVYGGDVALALFVLTLLLYGPAATFGPLYSRPSSWAGLLAGRDPFAPAAPLAVLGFYGVSPFSLAVATVAAVVTGRLTVAYGRCFRFPHPFWAAAASQVIVVLLVSVVALQLRWLTE